MEKDTLIKITKKFLEFRNYHAKRLNEQFEITQSEWVDFFTHTSDRLDTLLRPRGVSRIRRINATQPWHVDNLDIADKETRTYIIRKPVAPNEGDAELTTAFARYSIEEPDDTVVVLSKAQWIALLRESQPD